MTTNIRTTAVLLVVVSAIWASVVLATAGCSAKPITPAQHVQNLEYETDAIILACKLYQDPLYPRNDQVTSRCNALLGTIK